MNRGVQRVWDQHAVKAVILGFGILGFLVLLFAMLSLVLPPVRQLAHDASSWAWGFSIEKFNQQRDDLTKQIADLNQRITDLQANKGATEADVEKLKQQVNELQVQLSLKEKQLQDLLASRQQPSAPSPPPPTDQPNQPVLPTSPQVLFFDDFNHGPSNGWLPVSGSWLGQAGGYTVSEGWSGDYYSYVAQGKTWDNYAVDVDLLDINPHSRFGIVVRADGAGDLAIFSVEGVDWYLGGWVCIRTVSSGVEQRCQEVPLRMSSQTHLRVEVIGNRIIAKIGGMKVSELTGGFPGRGMPGLHIVNADGLRFDDFKVTSISDFSDVGIAPMACLEIQRRSAASASARRGFQFLFYHGVSLQLGIR
jgi:uncharacterized coiled-coil protein SlyX